MSAPIVAIIAHDLEFHSRLTENDVVTALAGFDGLWEALFPAEQARIARLLIERVTVSADGLAVDLRTEGLGSVIREMVTPERRQAA